MPCPGGSGRVGGGSCGAVVLSHFGIRDPAENRMGSLRCRILHAIVKVSSEEQNK